MSIPVATDSEKGDLQQEFPALQSTLLTSGFLTPQFPYNLEPQRHSVTSSYTPMPFGGCVSESQPVYSTYGQSLAPSEGFTDVLQHDLGPDIRGHSFHSDNLHMPWMLSMRGPGISPSILFHPSEVPPHNGGSLQAYTNGQMGPEVLPALTTDSWMNVPVVSQLDASRPWAYHGFRPVIPEGGVQPSWTDQLQYSQDTRVTAITSSEAIAGIEDDYGRRSNAAASPYDASRLFRDNVGNLNRWPQSTESTVASPTFRKKQPTGSSSDPAPTVDLVKPTTYITPEPFTDAHLYDDLGPSSTPLSRGVSFKGALNRTEHGPDNNECAVRLTRSVYISPTGRKPVKTERKTISRATKPRKPSSNRLSKPDIERVDLEGMALTLANDGVKCEWDAGTGTVKFRRTRDQQPKQQCQSCGKQFQKHHFNRHMKIHNKKRPYACSVCKKMFDRNDNRVAHLVTHLHMPSKRGRNKQMTLEELRVYLSNEEMQKVRLVYLKKLAIGC